MVKKQTFNDIYEEGKSILKCDLCGDQGKWCEFHSLLSSFQEKEHHIVICKTCGIKIFGRVWYLLDYPVYPPKTCELCKSRKGTSKFYAKFICKSDYKPTTKDEKKDELILCEICGEKIWGRLWYPCGCGG